MPLSARALGAAAAAALAIAAPAAAQSPDSLDPTFSSDGIVTTPFGPGEQDIGLALARQADGKLVMAGSTGGTGVFGSGGDFGLIRYNVDGSLDTTFDGDGLVTTSFVSDPGEDDEAWAVAVTPDGKIVAAGVADEGTLGGFKNFAVARYNSDGSLDTTFSLDGKATVDFSTSDHANAVAVQPDGKIVVGGADANQHWALARLSTDGTLDATFDGDGRVTTALLAGGLDEVTDIEVQPDDRIMAGGTTGSSISTHQFAAVRYNTDGSLDTGFDGDGKAMTSVTGGDDVAHGLALQSDGKPVLAGDADNEFGVVRFNTDGSLDTGFDGDGKVVTNISTTGAASEAHDVAINADDKIYAVGRDDACDFDCDFGVVRYNTDGSLDTGFDGDGKAFVHVATGDYPADWARGAVVQPDGKLVVGGYANQGSPSIDIDYAAVRFLANGDDVDPAVAVTDSDPDSPATDNNPEIKGTADDPAATVRLYTTSDCSGSPAATGAAATFTTAGLTVTVPADSTTTFRARATDVAGNVSACSSSSVTYVEDSTAPARPTVTDTDPDSPADDNQPEVKGTAEAGSTVRIYTSALCNSGLVGEGPAADFTSTGITATVASDSTTTLYARVFDAAGNASGCALTGITYVEDSSTPPAPAITSTTPASPANENDPEFKGTAETGSTVKLYSASDCSGSPAATGTAAAFASPGFTVAVADDSSTTLYATATDAVGHVSPCSPGLTYVEDSTAPGAPTIADTDPDSPSNDNEPEVKGSDGGGTPTEVLVYEASDCAGAASTTGSIGAFTGAGISVLVTSNSTTSLSAKARDAAGNLSACSNTITYTEDSNAPSVPSVTDTDPDSPANDNGPEVKGSAEAGSTVRLYTSSDCSGTPVATGAAATYASPGLTVTVADNTVTTFKATATDAAGNTSGCSLISRTYVEDSIAPDTPAITDTDPDSPSSDDNPEVKGTVGGGSPAQVRIFKSTDCSGAATSGSVAVFTSSGITVAVPGDATTNLSARAVDTAGNESACSNTVPYVEDSTAPATPSITDSDPNSPANDNFPEIKGTAEPGAVVRLYQSTNCSGGVMAQGSAADFASPGLTISVSNDASTFVTARATDAAGNASACSTTFTYTEDSTAPAAPSVTDTDPNSPANDNEPEVKGSAASGSTVRLYTSADCSGSPVASGGASAYSSPGLTVTVSDDSSTTLWATATDAAGNVSACSATSLTYVEDSTAPATPTLTDTDPDPPANDNSAEVKGSAESGSTVRLYTTSDCSGAATATGTAAALNGTGITVTVANDSTTTLRATATDAAGNASACSSPITYVEDSTAPAAPTFSDTDPDSPGNENDPEVKGSAEAGSTVKLYGNSVCLSTVAAQGSAADFASPGLTVTVADNTSHTYWATATDAAGNVSSCSSSSITYVEDSTAPSAPSLTDTDPDSPANENDPEVKGSAASGSTVRLYATSDCSGPPAATGPAATYSSPGLTVSVPDDSSTTFRATATDAAGNTSGCSSTSLTYVEDSTGPDAPTITDTDPDSPANDNNPEVKGTAGGGSPTQVSVYKSSNCSGVASATGTVAAFTGSGITVSVTGDAATPLSAIASDAAGNTSGCSNSVTYVEDSTAPAAPTFTDTDPDSPANHNVPRVKGAAEAGSTVRLYTNSTCTSAIAAEDSAGAFDTPGLAVSVSNDTTTTFRARATDAAGNTSACSTSTITYTEDSTPPAAPTFSDTDPDSPANDNNPEIKGSAAAGTTVSLYTTADCSGTAAATGSAAGFASPGLTVAVADDTNTTLRARATDPAGNASGCSSGSIGYVEDSTAPAAPTLTGTDPDSPANDNSPEVEGTAEAGSTVRLYETADCSGTAAATGSAAGFGSPGLTVTVPDDSATTFRATATDGAGNTSACSASTIAYTEDSTAPAAPTLSDTDPDSPANDNNPEIKGSAAAGSTVSLYTTSDCSGAAAATGSAAAFASPGLTATVGNDTATTFRARASDTAGNASACSTSTIVYSEDSTAPAAPTLSDTDPDSPANENSPVVRGSAAAGSTVTLHTTSDCSGAPAATGSAASLGSPGLTVAVADDTTTTFRATATDSAGNASACSSGSLTYVEDSTAPGAPTLSGSDPDSPANDGSPRIKGAAESGSTVSLHTTADCSGTAAATGTAASFASPGLSVTVANDSTTTFRARTIDAAGNVSSCSAGSLTYLEDSTAPEAPTVTDTDPDSPSSDATPNVKGSAEANSTVSLYTGSDCSGAPAASGSAAAFASPGIPVTVSENAVTSFRATATDAAGNTSGCSTSPLAYVEDSASPAAPSLDDTDPDSPANDNQPELRGTAEPGSTVRIYSSNDCSGAPLATGSAASFASPGLTVSVGDDTTTDLRATATDAVGQTSACSGPRTYAEDSTAPETTIDGGPSGSTDATAVTFSFSASEPATFACRMDGGAFDGCGSPVTVGPLGLGPHTFEVRATDAAGNVEGTLAGRSFTVTGPPAPDADGDGSPDDEDCDDTDARIRPGATDVPGNGIDENCDGTDAPVVPTNGDDTLTGTSAADTICGLLGNDVIIGLGGGDTLWGDACGDKLRSIFGSQAATDGNDKLYGRDGNDLLFGAGGKDTLKGGTGRDKLYGGGGNDSLYGESGKDALDGGSGDDKLSGGTDTNTYRGGSGNDVVSARNRKRETVDCGSGKKDRATVDRVDRVKSCERVSRR